MRSSTGFHQFPSRPQQKDPVEYTHGCILWEYFARHPEWKNWFDTLMAENRHANLPWFEIYPAADELGGLVEKGSEEVLFVDVGGNRGLDILEFRQKYPELPGRLALQDLPETVERVKVEEMEGVEVMGYDFFTEQPIKGMIPKNFASTLITPLIVQHAAYATYHPIPKSPSNHSLLNSNI